MAEIDLTIIDRLSNVKTATRNTKPKKKEAVKPIVTNENKGTIPTVLKDKYNGLERGLKGKIEGGRLRLQVEADKRKKEIEQANKIMKLNREWEEKASSLRGDIIRGLKNGEPIEKLLLKALLCISNMTGNTAFYWQTSLDLINIYGYGKENKVILEEEKKKIQKRLDNLLKRQSSYKKKDRTTDDYKRLSNAIEKHREDIVSLEKIINRE